MSSSRDVWKEMVNSVKDGEHFITRIFLLLLNINSTIQVHSYFLQYKRMNLTNGDTTRSLCFLILIVRVLPLFCVHNKLFIWIRDFNLHKLGLKCKCCYCYSQSHHCSPHWGRWPRSRGRGGWSPGHGYCLDWRHSPSPTSASHESICETSGWWTVRTSCYNPAK